MSDTRVVLRRHCPYSTRKNKFRKIRTPGKNVRVLSLNKKTSTIKCADKKIPIQGIPRSSSLNFMKLCKRKKKISRIYGGCLSSKSVRERITKAFLLEEKKIVKKFLKTANSKATG